MCMERQLLFITIDDIGAYIMENLTAYIILPRIRCLTGNRQLCHGFRQKWPKHYKGRESAQKKG